MSTAPVAATAPTRSPRQPVLVLALLLTGLSMRTAVTSVGAALDDLQRGLGASATTAGLFTTLPVICFAVMGALTPRLVRGIGAHSLLCLSLALTTLGLAVRPIGTSSVWFALASVLALSGGAIANILMPTLVKQHFPDRLGHMTALYTTALAVGVTAGAGLTVPIGEATTGWRFGLGSWAVLSALAVGPWLPSVLATRRAKASPGGAAHDVRPDLPLAALLRSRTAWWLMVLFAAQSMQAYIAFGWFARFLHDHGIASGKAGAMVAVLAAMSIPVSLVAPRVAPPRLRAVLIAFCACNLVAYAGLAVAPVSGAWVWMVLAGIGGGTFPVALALIGLRARTANTTAALSAFVQSIGYVIAGVGPLLFGALFGLTGSWALPLGVLFVALSTTLVASWPTTADRYVDDELRPALSPS